MEKKTRAACSAFLPRCFSLCALSLGRPPPGCLAAGCLFCIVRPTAAFGQDAYAAYTMQVAQTGKRCGRWISRWTETRHYRLESKAEA